MTPPDLNATLNVITTLAKLIAEAVDAMSRDDHQRVHDIIPPELISGMSRAVKALEAAKKAMP